MVKLGWVGSRATHPSILLKITLSLVERVIAAPTASELTETNFWFCPPSSAGWRRPDQRLLGIPHCTPQQRCSPRFRRDFRLSHVVLCLGPASPCCSGSREQSQPGREILAPGRKPGTPHSRACS